MQEASGESHPSNCFATTCTCRRQCPATDLPQLRRSVPIQLPDHRHPPQGSLGHAAPHRALRSHCTHGSVTALPHCLTPHSPAALCLSRRRVPSTHTTRRRPTDVPSTYYDRRRSGRTDCSVPADSRTSHTADGQRQRRQQSPRCSADRSGREPNWTAPDRSRRRRRRRRQTGPAADTAALTQPRLHSTV